jgi:diguanylate cyclase (GGDEF)-like protein
VVSRGSARIVDVSEVQLRLDMIRAGVWLTWGICSAGSLYALFTLDQQNREAILVLLGLGFVGGVVVPLLPLEKIVRSRFDNLFFGAWSIVDMVLIALLVAADGGGLSPFAFVFFVPLVFAALFYPLPLFVIVGAANVFLYVAASWGTEVEGALRIPIVAGVLGSTAVMCAWLAQSHDRQRVLLSHLSRTDPLTDALNRRGFEELLDAELAESLRSGQPVGLLMLDLDGFKQVNDSLGHAEGDRLLAWVVGRVTAAARPMDSVGRLGGDEFAVLSPGASCQDCRAIAERVSEQLAERIGVTIGVASYPEDGVSREELYRAADSELYSLKYGSEQLSGATELTWAETMAKAVQTRMGGSADQGRAVRFTSGLARRLGWTGRELANVSLAAMVHDVGKVPVPDRILQKPGPLEPEEYEEVKRHLVKGAEMVGRIEGLGAVAPWLRHARENYDGSGYPDGLAGEEIPLASRMLRVVDAFNAMTSERPYRPAMSFDEALEQLRRNAGRMFDPKCVVEFEAVLMAELASSA